MTETPQADPGGSDELLIQGHIDVLGHVYLLRAEPDPSGGRWIARVDRYSAEAGAAPVLRHVRGEENQLGTLADISGSLTADGPTEDAAIEALEHEIRAAVTEATRSD